MKKYLIYRYISPSGKSYIGQTKNLIGRETSHKNPKSKCRAFANAIKKYGWDNFTREILEDGLILEEANNREVYWIAFYNTRAPNGYNLTSGGSNYEFSEETIKLFREMHSGENNYWYGKKLSEEHKNKLGKKGIDNPNFGVPHTQEWKDNQSKLMKGRNTIGVGKEHPKSKKYIIIFPDGHIEKIHGLREFCRNNNLEHSAMSAVANGKYKTHRKFKCIHDNLEKEL